MKRFKSYVAVILSMLLMLQVMLIPANQVEAAISPRGVDISLEANESEVESGEQFTYTLNYSFSSVDAIDFDEVTLDLLIPTGIEYLDVVKMPIMSDPVVTTVPEGTLLRFGFASSPPSGSTFSMQVNVKFHSHITPDGYGAGLYAVATITLPDDPTTPLDVDPEVSVSESVEVISRASSLWQLTKTKIKPVPEPLEGSVVEYSILLDNLKNSDIGNLDITDLVITDTIPAGSQFVSALPAPTSVSGNDVTWELGGPHRNDMDIRIVVYYPEAVFPAGTPVINHAGATYTPLGGTLQSLSDSITHTFITVPQDGGSGWDKRVHPNQREISPGQDVTFYVGGFTNNANVPIHGASITDMTPNNGAAPEALSLTQVQTGSFNNVPGDYMRVQYTLDSTDPVTATWVDWVGGAATVGGAVYGISTNTHTLLAADLMLGPGDHIKGIRFLFDGELPVLFSQTSSIALTYQLDSAYTPTPPPDFRTNTARLQYAYTNEFDVEVPVSMQDSADVYFHAGRPLMELRKTVDNPKPFIPNDVVEYTITVTNTDLSSAPLEDPIIVDLLPNHMTLEPGTWELDDYQNLGLPALNPITTELRTDAGGPTATYTLIKSTFSGPVSLPVGASFRLKYNARIAKYTEVGSLKNIAKLSAANAYLNDYHFDGGVNPLLDIHGHIDATGTKRVISAEASVYVNRVVQLDSVKLVRGELDTGWTNIGVTTPGGRVDYKLTISNESNVDVKNIVVVDVLPRVGDQGVRVNTPRGSQWSTILTDEVQVVNAALATEIEISYSTDANVKMETGSWSTTPPLDLTTVTAVKFVFDSDFELLKGQSVDLEWPMRAPINAPVGQIAWNSFGYKAEHLDGTPIKAAEPPKVGVRVQDNMLGEIGNYVWADLNGDGIQNNADAIDFNDSKTIGDGAPTDLYGPNEMPGINGIRVELLNGLTDAVMQHTVTANDAQGNPGYYLFTNLPAGTYKVRFHAPHTDITELPFVTNWTLQTQGADDALDSNVDAGNHATVTTTPIVLLHAEKNHTIDAGLIPPLGTIGNYVWLDSDWNGIQDGGHSGIAGVEVKLTGPDGEVLPSQTTDGTGQYLFTGLKPGWYEAEFTPGATHIFTQKEQGSNPALDSNVGTPIGTNQADARGSKKTDRFYLPLGSDDLTIDAGVVPLTNTASLGDYVWIDINDNGIQDAGELPMNNVRVRLYEQGNSTAIAETRTNASGYYIFENLQPGTYQVRFTLPSGYIFSDKRQGSDLAEDSDVNSSGYTDNITLLAGDVNLDIDAGLVPLASIGDYVWMDRDEEGDQDEAASYGVPNVTVRLYMNNVLMTDKTTTTSSTGYYKFSDLEPNEDYFVEFVLPAGYKFTQKSAVAPTDSNLDSDADETTGRTGIIRPEPDEDITTVDAGLIKLVSIGNYVWLDLNNNGIQDDWVDWNENGAEDPNESVGVNGVTVQLIGSDGVTPVPGVVDQVTADGPDGKPGYYLFQNLDPGTYYVKFTHPGASYGSWTIKNAVASTEANDSDADPTVGASYGLSDAVTMMAGDDPYLHVDAGLRSPLGSIGNYVWFDANGDGVQDAAESGENGLVVRLLRWFDDPVDGWDYHEVATTTTANNGTNDGHYQFNNLIPGLYKVQFSKRANIVNDKYYLFTEPGTDPASDADSNANKTTGLTDTIVLPVGGSNMTIDAGFVELASLGDLVWIDANNNGIFDAIETGWTGAPIEVKLYNEFGAEIGTTTTGPTGLYRFHELAPGKYYVEFNLPSGYIFALQNVTDPPGDETNDSDADTAGVTGLVELDYGDHYLHLDAGLVKLRNIGNYVWMDRNSNGVQDAGEDGVNGVVVTLHTPSGAAVLDGLGNPRTETTANDGSGNPGYYLFTDVEPGDYKIKFDYSGLMKSYVFTQQESTVTGATYRNDSNADTTPGPAILGWTNSFTLAPEEDNLTIDAGLIELVSLGDYVWIDLNRNGLQDDWVDWNANGMLDPGEAMGLNGVTVELVQADGVTPVTGVPAQTTVDGPTGNPGYYLFEDIMPGSYRVKFTLPAGYTSWTAVDQGMNDLLDSDVDPTSGLTGVIVLTAGDLPNLTVDAGLTPILGSIGNYVWNDANGDGDQDAGESGQNGLTVSLLKWFNDPVDGWGYHTIATDTTDTESGENGRYLFGNLEAGLYKVQFSKPADTSSRYFRYTVKGSDPLSDNDSNADLTTGLTDTITLPYGQSDLTIDAGFIELASLGDRVWIDANDNGIFDGPDSYWTGPPITVTLYDATNTGLRTKSTDATGYYRFDRLTPGQYSVGFSLPAGYIFAEQNATIPGATEANDSDANALGRTDLVTLTYGQHYADLDAGLVQLRAIGNYVWMDRNRDGKQDADEDGVNGVVVHLLDVNGDPILDGPGGNPRTETTADDGSGNPGYYLFTELEPGVDDYRVRFDLSGLPRQYVFTRLGGGTLEEDSNVDPNAAITGMTGAFTLPPEGDNLTIDAGIIELVHLGDYVWEDTGVIGVQEAGEAGVNGIVATLLDAAGNPVIGVTPIVTYTHAGRDGYYLFENLLPGSYQVRFEIPAMHPNAGYLFTKKQVVGVGGVTADTDSNVNAIGVTDTITLIAGQDDLTIDAGIVNPASIGDYVWIDENNNGIQDPGEKGMNEVTVELYDEDGILLDTMDTVDDGLGNPGYYGFDNLIPGTYKVKFNLPSGYAFARKGQGSDAALDSDVLLSGETEAITLLPGENNRDIDAGLVYVPPMMISFGSLGDYVWLDVNENGLQDADEPGVNGVTVQLYDDKGIMIGETVTGDANGKAGYYLYDNLIALNTYQVKFVLPEGYRFTEGLVGSDTALDSDASADGWAASVYLYASQKVLTIDAGLVELPIIPEEKPIDAESVTDADEEEFEMVDEFGIPSGIPDIEPDQPSVDKSAGIEVLPKTGESAPVMTWIGLLLMLASTVIWTVSVYRRRVLINKPKL